MTPYTCVTFLGLLVLVTSKRSVLFLFEDDGGFSISPYGERVMPSPHLAALSKCGVTFNNAYTSVSSCSPSRASLLTGLPTHQNGMFGLCQGNTHFSSISGVQSLPNILNANGIATGIIGKYHVWGSPDVGLAAFNFSWGNNPSGPGGCAAGASYSCPSTDYNLVSRNISHMRDLALSFWTDFVPPNTPSFLYVGFGDSHRCGGSGQGDFCELYGLNAAGESTIPGWTPFVADPATVDLPAWIPDTPIARADYAHMMTAKNRMDQGVGMLLSALATTPNGGDTMVIYSADNGAPFPRGKTTFYQAGMGEPLIIAVPNSTAGAYTSIAASLLDLAPTILDWLGVPIPTYQLVGSKTTMLGKSLLPVVAAAEGGSPTGGGPACLASPPPSSAAGVAAAAPRHPQLFTAAEVAAAFQQPPSPSPTTLLTLSNATAFTFGSFQSHEVQMYFPTRYVLASDSFSPTTNPTNTTTLLKLVYYIAGAAPSGGPTSPGNGGLSFPIASDLWAAPTFQDLLARANSGESQNWAFNISTYLGGRKRYELFDVLADPLELKDLAGEPSMAGVVAQLTQALQEWQAQTNDPWVIKQAHE